MWPKVRDRGCVSMQVSEYWNHSPLTFPSNFWLGVGGEFRRAPARLQGLDEPIIKPLECLWLVVRMKGGGRVPVSAKAEVHGKLSTHVTQFHYSVVIFSELYQVRIHGLRSAVPSEAPGLHDWYLCCLREFWSDSIMSASQHEGCGCDWSQKSWVALYW